MRKMLFGIVLIVVIASVGPVFAESASGESGIQVPSVLELKQGLDIGEHGMEAYGGFQIFSTS